MGSVVQVSLAGAFVRAARRRLIRVAVKRPSNFDVPDLITVLGPLKSFGSSISIAIHLISLPSPRK
jgi:hypothetical protein